MTGITGVGRESPSACAAGNFERGRRVFLCNCFGVQVVMVLWWERVGQFCE